MRSNKRTKKTIKQWLNVSAKPKTRDRIWREVLFVQEQSRKTDSALVRPNIWRIIMKTRTVKFAVAAVVALIVIGGLTFLPSKGTDGKQWWLAPPAAWSQEIMDALDTFNSVTCREQLVTVMSDGSEHTSMTWIKFYTSNNSYRRDIYDGDFFREIQWYVPDGGNMNQHSIRFDLESYFIQTHTGSYGNNDPVDRLRMYVGLLDEADGQLGTEIIDGCECVGFEISASKYGSNPDEWMDRIWFDVETKLPVRIEKLARPITGRADMTRTTIQDQFDYDPGLTEDTFIPYTPEGFVFGHPDDIEAARKASEN